MSRAIQRAIEWERHVMELEELYEATHIKASLEEYKPVSFNDSCLRRHGIKNEEDNSEQIKIKGW